MLKKKPRICVYWKYSDQNYYCTFIQSMFTVKHESDSVTKIIISLVHFLWIMFVLIFWKTIKIFTNNIFCIPITFDNHITACFSSNKEYSGTIQTRQTQIVNSIFPGFNIIFKDCWWTNFGTDLLHIKILKVKNSNSNRQIVNA